MMMVRRGDEDGVEPLGLDHLAIIDMELRLWKLGPRLAGQVFIDIAQSDDFAAPSLVEFPPIGGGTIERTDDTDAQAFVGRRLFIVRASAAEPVAKRSSGRGGL